MSPSGDLLRSRFRGALLGVAVGDALGAPFEGSAPGRGSARAAAAAPGPWRYTDDTHMTIALAESLLECEGFDGAHMAARFAADYRAEPWRGYGPGPPQVFRLVEAGAPWQGAAQTLFGGAGSFGNGGAMRVAPAALLAFPEPSRVAALAADTARVTHAHPYGVEGAVAQATAVAALLRSPGDPALHTAGLLAEVRGAVRSDLFRSACDSVAALLPAAPQQQVVATLGNGIEAFRSVPTALYAFLRHPTAFEDAIEYAVALGGDTDTIAAMTGALAGARLGEDAIPAQWRAHVEGAERLRTLADELYRRAR